MKRLLISLTIFALLVVPQFAFGSDVDDLKAASEKGLQAFCELDAETLVSTQYPEFVALDYGEAFPTVVNTKAEAVEGLKMTFNSMEFFQLVPYNMQYKVIGDTGIVWGNFTFMVKPKGESMHKGFGKMTSTWIKKDGKWYMIMIHNSDLPTGF